MQSNSVSTTAPQYTNGSFVGNQAATYKELSATNGLVQGNRKTPNPITFRKVSRDGKLYKTIQMHRNGPSSIGSDTTVCGKKIYGEWFSGTPVGLGSIIQPDWGITDDAALEKIYDQIRGNSNLIVDFAEGAQTIRMLRNTLNLKKFFSEFAREFMKPHGKRGATSNQRRLDYVTGKWLEYRYGWTPLVNSIYDAANELGKQVKDMQYPVRARSAHQQYYKEVHGSGTYDDPREVCEAQMTYRTEYCMFFGFPPGVKLYDWTSLNPLAIAWELTPLSFVSDWVVNVSQQLSLWENYFLFQSAFKSGYRTRTFKEIRDVTLSGTTSLYVGPNSFGTFLKIKSGGYTNDCRYKDRTVLDALPRPSGVRVKVSFGAKRQLDAAALFHQLVNKKIRF